MIAQFEAHALTCRDCKSGTTFCPDGARLVLDWAESEYGPVPQEEPVEANTSPKITVDIPLTTY